MSYANATNVGVYVFVLIFTRLK